MRKKKIRGHRRRWKDIENWRVSNLHLDLIDYLIQVNNKYFAKIRVHPWSGLTLTNSELPQPRGKTKRIMLNGLLDIYENWKKQLDELGKPYYLKIWLFEPRFTQSQVVCAIGDDLGFYENTFSKPDQTKTWNSRDYGQLKNRMEYFTWDHHLDEDQYQNTEIGEPETYASYQDYLESKIWFEKLLKKPHRSYQFKEPIGGATECYLFKRGEVWIGERK